MVELVDTKDLKSFVMCVLVQVRLEVNKLRIFWFGYLNNTKTTLRKIK
jgi:hypothetical protein